MSSKNPSEIKNLPPNMARGPFSMEGSCKSEILTKTLIRGNTLHMLSYILFLNINLVVLIYEKRKNIFNNTLVSLNYRKKESVYLFYSTKRLRWR